EATQAGTIKAFVDSGTGFSAHPSSAVTLPAGESRIAHFQIYGGNIRRICLELPGNGATVFILGDIAVRSAADQGRGVHRRYAVFASTDFRALNGVDRVVNIGRQQHFYTSPAAS